LAQPQCFFFVAKEKTLEPSNSPSQTETVAGIAETLKGKDPFTTLAPSNDGVSLLQIGLALIAIISIWLIFQTYRQHIALANNELRNRRTAKKIRL